MATNKTKGVDLEAVSYKGNQTADFKSSHSKELDRIPPDAKETKNTLLKSISDSNLTDIRDIQETNSFINFYRTASTYVENKYDVFLYGQAIDDVIDRLATAASGFNQGVHTGYRRNGNQNSHPLNTQMIYSTQSFRDWASNHVYRFNARGAPTGTKYFVWLKWACDEIIVPMPNLDIKQDMTIDTIKSIKTPIVMGYVDTNILISLDIVEQKNLMWYQFFNALFNNFFKFPYIKPINSIKQLSLVAYARGNVEYTNIPISTKRTSGNTYELPVSSYVSNSEGDFNLNNSSNRSLVDQVFEYNSIVPKTINPLTWKSKVDDVRKFKVELTAPHPFNEPFKSDLDSIVCDLELTDTNTPA